MKHPAFQSLQRSGVCRRQFALLWVIACGALAGSGAEAQDGRSVLLKTLKAYQALESYDGSATVDIKILGRQGQLQNRALQAQSLYAILKFKKPNRLMLHMTTPSGTRKVYCDGRDFYVLDVLNNQYTRDPAPQDTRGMSELLLRRAGIIAALDPLFFLLATSLPGELSNLKVSGADKINGRDVVKVTGTTRMARQERTLPDGRKIVLPAVNRTWTWWVDRQNNMVLRVESRDDNFTFNVPRRQGNQVVVQRVPAISVTRHNVASVRPNGVLDDSVFQFQKPARATERKALQELLKGKS
ncbi:MAG: DUF2092 domain-containing protein [Chloroherpetonaceae bacterium]|nr:DUF2092 domain-containing protein [Chthonomonadaceae bacterium]MDW8206640.1 DUF2092 domain-containing protein [Chloroherpetonaceae bacterium]